MSEYKDTLHLPKTDFPMKADLINSEPKMLAHWNAIGLYELLRKRGRSREKFVLHDGPPFANGAIHLGHALNKILKDFINKAKTLSGFDTPFAPGWDCHGLPIELNVEKRLAENSQSLSDTDFRQACRDYASEQVAIGQLAFERLGIVADWKNPYITMSNDYQANVIRALAKVIERGHLLYDTRPMYWCTDCASALSDAEIEYEESRQSIVDVRFSVIDEAALLAQFTHLDQPNPLGSISFPVSTQTAWALPDTQAMAVHPTTTYVLVQTQDERLVIAQHLVEETLRRYNNSDHAIVGTCIGKDLEGLLIQHPFYERAIPIILGESIPLDMGTGNDATTPSFSPDDFVLAQRYDLTISNPVNESGFYSTDTQLFANQHIAEAQQSVLSLLNATGKLIAEQAKAITIRRCWRHGTPVIFRITAQWFIALDQNGLRRDASEVLQQLQWIPEWTQAHLSTLIENRYDWCISRQRVWGTPLPLFLHKETHQPHPNTIKLLHKIADHFSHHGSDSWFSLDEKKWLGDDADHYRKVNDTIDVWFDSGVSHQCVLEARPELICPASLYVEGCDQLQGWLQSSLLLMIAIEGISPYQQSLTHGFTVDAAGHKMSKARGNVTAPESIVDVYGADILRLWVATTDYRHEPTISDEMLSGVTDAYRRIRNTARFLLANIFDFDANHHLVKPTQMVALDRWILDRALQLQNDIINAYDEYDFLIIQQKILNFCSIELGGFYFEIIKDRQYTCSTNSIARRSCQSAMFHLLEALVRWIAPIISFTADEIWQQLPGVREPSVFLTTWYDELVELPSNYPLDRPFWDDLFSIRDIVNKRVEQMREQGLLNSTREAEVTLYAHKALYLALKQIHDELRFALRTASARVLPLENKTSSALLTSLDGLLIDVQVTTASICIRCRDHRDDIGTHLVHPELCQRCICNVTSDGEKRLFI